MLAASAGLGGARALATFVYVAPDAPDGLDPAREFLPTTASEAGATRGRRRCWSRASWPRIRLRCARAFALFWTGFRAAVAGLPPVLPRLWHV